ncbi:hypothetical protein S83_063219, partial [Arachis hypogaea]
VNKISRSEIRGGMEGHSLSVSVCLPHEFTDSRERARNRGIAKAPGSKNRSVLQLKRELRSTHPTVLRVSLLVYSISVNTTTTTSKERFGLKRKTGTSLVYLINKELLDSWICKVGVPRQLFVTKNPSTIPYEITKAGMKLPLSTYLYFLIEVDTFLDYDNLSKGIVFTTDRPYQPGEQVFLSYGKKSNGELLLSYGFVPREDANPCDSVELSVSLKKFDQSYKEKLELLKKYGLSGPPSMIARSEE